MSVQEFWSYMRVLMKRWWLFLILCGATIGGLMYSFYSSPPEYEATVRFMVSAPPSTDVSLYPGLDRPTQAQQIAAIQSTLMELMQSPTIIWQTASAYQGSVSGDELRKGVTVEIPEESNFIWVSVRVGDPQEAADLANALVDTAKKYYGRLLAQSSALAREFISTLVEDELQQLQADNRALGDFKRYHQIEDLSAQISSERNIIWNLILKKDDAVVNRQTELVLAYDLVIAEHQEELQRLTSLSSEYETLQDNIRRTVSQYEFLRDKEAEAQLKEDEVLRVGYIQVVEAAYPPSDPVSPFDTRIFAVGCIASLTVCVVIAFWLEYIGSRSPKDA